MNLDMHTLTVFVLFCTMLTFSWLFLTNAIVGLFSGIRVVVLILFHLWVASMLTYLIVYFLTQGA